MKIGIEKIKNIPSRIGLYIVLMLIGFSVFFPLYILFISSLKKNNIELNVNPIGFPEVWRFDNYINIFKFSAFGWNYLSSTVVTVSSILLVVILSSMASYALAKYSFKLNKYIYGMFVVGLFLPIRMGTLNILRVMVALDLMNNLFGLIIIETVLGLPGAIFILTGFIKLLPEELSNSARIDGCSEPGIFFKIIVPLLKPALVTIVLFNLLRIWNDIWWPLLMITDSKLKVVPLAVSVYIDEFTSDYVMIFSFLNVASWPLIIIYLILSRHYIRGLTGGALKE
ncbi:MAG: carbohydrate ABC transporter permease [Actinobacteria bacterium]|nr:carbohydrate ABC transporter permease [Actinomycetota bacterium]